MGPEGQRERVGDRGPLARVKLMPTWDELRIEMLAIGRRPVVWIHIHCATDGLLQACRRWRQISAPFFVSSLRTALQGFRGGQGSHVAAHPFGQTDRTSPKYRRPPVHADSGGASAPPHSCRSTQAEIAFDRRSVKVSSKTVKNRIAKFVMQTRGKLGFVEQNGTELS